jgi:hypothetical protein
LAQKSFKWHRSLGNRWSRAVIGSSLPGTPVAGEAIAIEVEAFAIDYIARRCVLRPRSDCYSAGAKRD